MVRKSPLDIITVMSDVLNVLKRGEPHTINKIRELTGLHWNTVRDYLHLVEYVQKNLPAVSLNEEGVRISGLSAPYASLKEVAPADFTLVKLMKMCSLLSGGKTPLARFVFTDENMKLVLEEDDRQWFSWFVDEGFIDKVEGGYTLTEDALDIANWAFGSQIVPSDEVAAIYSDQPKDEDDLTTSYITDSETGDVKAISFLSAIDA